MPDYLKCYDHADNNLNQFQYLWNYCDDPVAADVIDVVAVVVVGIIGIGMMMECYYCVIGDWDENQVKIVDERDGTIVGIGV